MKVPTCIECPRFKKQECNVAIKMSQPFQYPSINAIFRKTSVELIGEIYKILAFYCVSRKVALGIQKNDVLRHK